MKFKIDGVLQDCTGSFDSLVSKGKGVTARKEGLPFDPGKIYDIMGQANSNSVLTFRLYTDSLQVKEYIFKTELGYNIVELKGFDGRSYKRFYPYRAKGDSIILNITRYSDKTIDGNFSGRLSQFDQAYTYQTVTITEGEFKNVPLFYY